jgi:predicted nuclease of predicted toxin-antitoxin system
MKILIDECLPRQLKPALSPMSAATVTEMKWTSIKNGKLLDLAERNDFTVFLTADRNLRHQQNLSDRKISVVVLKVLKNQMKYIIPLLPTLIEKLQRLTEGSVIEVA